MREPGDELTRHAVDLCARYLRRPTGFYTEDGVPVITFDPPLTAAEQTVLARLVRLARSGLDLTPDEWERLEPALVTLRTFRQTTDAQFSALTAAQRDARLIEAQRATIDLLRVVLRD